MRLKEWKRQIKSLSLDSIMLSSLMPLSDIANILNKFSIEKRQRFLNQIEWEPETLEFIVHDKWEAFKQT